MEEYSGMILAQTAEMSRVLATDQRFSDEEKVQKVCHPSLTLIQRAKSIR